MRPDELDAALDAYRDSYEQIMEAIEEGLSRAVVGGLVTEWMRIRHAIETTWWVKTNDGLEHRYTFEPARAFIDAVYAAERAHG